MKKNGTKKKDVKIKVHKKKDAQEKSHKKTVKHDTQHDKKAEHHVTKHYGQKFCPNCGRKIEHGTEFCAHCKSVDFKFKDIDMTVCNNCHSYLHRNKWAKYKDINHVIEEVVSDNIKDKVNVSRLKKMESDALTAYKAGVNKDITIEVSMTRQKFDLPAKFHVTLCPKCSKQGTKYFQSILQVRNSTGEINAFIKSEIAKQAEKGIHLNKEESVDATDDNIDFYITSQSYARTLAEKVRKNFGGIIKKNAQLFSINWETSKNLYRLNILLELPNYKKDDVIKKGDDLFKIVSFDKKVHVTNLKNNHKTSLPHSDSYDILKPVEVMIMKKYPEFEILDPNTYYQARLLNPNEKLQVNQKIKVIIDGGEAWLIRE